MSRGEEKTHFWSCASRIQCFAVGCPIVMVIHKAACTFFLLVLMSIWSGSAVAEKSHFIFASSRAGPEIKVFVSRPAGLATDRPVVFVMHGVNRNAEDYRDQWHELAIAHDFLLVVPEFNRDGFPGSRGYNLGNVFDADHNLLTEDQWAYSAIEPIFDEIRRRFFVTADSYSLYGHSAGSQFVHRFIFYKPDARVSSVVSANAGWYMMPDYKQGFPYGLDGAAVTSENLAKALQLHVTILLGDKDIDPQHEHLRRKPEAMAQGEHRLARGYTFFNAARASAKQLKVPFNWQLITVSGADHDNQLMAPAAVRYLLKPGSTSAD